MQQCMGWRPPLSVDDAFLDSFSKENRIYNLLELSRRIQGQFKFVTITAGQYFGLWLWYSWHDVLVSILISLALSDFNVIECRAKCHNNTREKYNDKLRGAEKGHDRHGLMRNEGVRRCYHWNTKKYVPKQTRLTPPTQSRRFHCNIWHHTQ